MVHSSAVVIWWLNQGWVTQNGLTPLSSCWYWISAGPHLNVCSSSRRMAKAFSELLVASKEGQVHYIVIHQVSTYVIFFDILLVRASHKAKSRAILEGIKQEHGYGIYDS